MAERIFTSNAYKVVEALAQRLGFATLDNYLQSLTRTEVKTSSEVTPLDAESLEKIRDGIKEGLRQ
ncbi:MAG: hypothetical protein ABI700_13540, partial [Chloroflexota bacterium]